MKLNQSKPRVWALILTVLGGLVAAETALAQTALQKLEGKLKEVLPPPAAGKPAPAAKEPTLAPAAGKTFQPGYLGLLADNVPGQKGVIITDVRAGGPAEQAGLKVGDRIVTINLVDLQDVDDFALLLGGIPAGRDVRLGVERDGKTIELVPKLAVRKVEAEKVVTPEEASVLRGDGAPAAGRGSLGITVVPLTGDLKEANGLTINRGAYISSVRQGSSAERAGIPPGAVIVSFNGTRVDTADELVAMASALQANQEVELTYYVGNRLTRKTVRATPPTAVGMGAVPPGFVPEGNAGGGLLGGGGAGPDRPLIRGLERIIGNAVVNGNKLGGGAVGGQPAIVEGAPGADGPVVMPAPLDSPEVVELRARVKSLESELEDLKARMEKLEQGK